MKKRLIYFACLFPVILALSEYVIFVVLQFSGMFLIPFIEYAFIFLSIFCPLVFVAVMLADGKKYLRLKSWLYTVSGVWMGLTIYLFAAAVATALVIYIDSLYNFPLSFFAIGIFFFGIAKLITLFGVITAYSPKVVTWEVRSSVLASAWSGKKIVLISDTHLGHLYKARFIRNVVELVNKEKPDIIFHAGDIIDGPTFDYNKVFEPLNDLQSNLGTFYTEGNHERYSRDYANFRAEFEKIKTITDMTDKKTIVLGTQILGLSYKEHETPAETAMRLDAVGFDGTTPSIVLLHNPLHARIVAEKGASLVLSGHTHGGQCFPMTLIIKKIYGHYGHGVTYTNGHPSVTTFGVGAAMSPLRVGTASEIVVLKIV